MGVNHKPVKTKRSGTGGRMGTKEGKKLCYFGCAPTHSKVSQKEVRVMRNIRGSSKKVVLKSAQYANVRDKEGKIRKVKLKNVIETPDNRHNARQNILTMGAIVDSDIGRIRITNRVGQDGVVNGILI